jgi:hypothetical protein
MGIVKVLDNGQVLQFEDGGTYQQLTPNGNVNEARVIEETETETVWAWHKYVPGVELMTAPDGVWYAVGEYQLDPTNTDPIIVDGVAYPVTDGVAHVPKGPAE